MVAPPDTRGRSRRSSPARPTRLDIDYGYRAATPFNISGRLFADDNRTGADETEAGMDQVGPSDS